MDELFDSPGGGPTRRAASIDNPSVLAAGLALLYMVLCTLYIAVSGQWAAGVAGSVRELQRIELFKGFAFIVVTGLVFFGVAAYALRRAAAQERRLFQQERALARAENRALSGLFAASVAHDINNLLTVAQAHTAKLADSVSRTALERALGEIAALAQRMTVLSRERVPDMRTPIDLEAGARTVVALAKTHDKVRDRKITIHAESPITVHADRPTLGRALFNLVLNAAEATATDGRIEVRLRIEPEQIWIEVHDDGPGIPDALHAAIFEPFYTTKPDGSGLGLISVKVCAEAHGGQVEIARSDLGGACVRIGLPP